VPGHVQEFRRPIAGVVSYEEPDDFVSVEGDEDRRNVVEHGMPAGRSSGVRWAMVGVMDPAFEMTVKGL